MKEEAIIRIGNGIIDQIDIVCCYNDTITEESLLKMAIEMDKQFDEEYPFCGNKGFVIKLLKECLEYNTDTSALPLNNKSEDIVRTTDII